LPSVAPDVCYANPTKYDGVESGMPVQIHLVEELLPLCSNTLDEHYLPQDFQKGADMIFKLIGSPEYDLICVWDVFALMKDKWHSI
jgi:hypothetical protein